MHVPNQMEQVTSRSKSNLAENCYLTSPWDPRGPMGRSDSNSVLVLSLQRNLFVLREIRAMQVNGLQGCHGGGSNLWCFRFLAWNQQEKLNRVNLKS